MHRSKNRDVYMAKLNNSAQGDAQKMMEGLARSPFRSHRMRANRILDAGAALAKVLKEQEVAHAPA